MSDTDHGPRAPARVRRVLPMLCCLAVVVLGVLVTLPFSGHQLAGEPSFVPAMLALVCALDLLSAALLARQFRSTGDHRTLALASSYAFSLAVLVGYGAAFPGVIGDQGPLGDWPSTAPWLWVCWHTGFPVLLGAAAAPWPRRWSEPAPARSRPRRLAAVVGTTVALGAGCDVVATLGRGWLPPLIDGLETSAMTRVAGPVMVPLVTVAAVLAVVGALRLRGPVQWAAVAATAAWGDMLLTRFSYSRYSLGWYAGRTLTILSCGVVLLAMLAEFSRLERAMAEEAERLRRVLGTMAELEAVQTAVLTHMSGGILLHAGDGRLLASNPAAEGMLGLTGRQLRDEALRPLGWQLLRADGTSLPADELPSAQTLATGRAQYAQRVGVRLPDGQQRWLLVTTALTGTDDHDRAPHVVSSLSDDTDVYAEELLRAGELAEVRDRVRDVLDTGGPQIVVQPIVELGSGRIVGGEALARFRGTPPQSPDRWFGDAARVGLGADLELAAVAAALAQLPGIRRDAYLSVNVSPGTASGPALLALLRSVGPDASRVVIELTEHTDVEDYDALVASLAGRRGLGAKIAVDDTGAGFASLRHILRLRPDVVKLDRDLVRGVHDDPARRALAAGLVAFAGQIGAYLVAEGIETSEELVALRERRGHARPGLSPRAPRGAPPAPARGGLSGREERRRHRGVTGHDSSADSSTSSS